MSLQGWQPENLSYNGKDTKMSHRLKIWLCLQKENENGDEGDNLCSEFLDKIESLGLFKD